MLVVLYVIHSVSYIGNIANALSSARKLFLSSSIPQVSHGHPLDIISWTLAFQSILVQGPAAPGAILETQNLRPHTQTLESKSTF